ncbi:MAG: hypothetical protein GY771_01180 [bacterium]|nr:hypothetical protein [bacterium]
MLPDNKKDFPKCIYLDQNMWSNLAKTHYGGIKDEKWETALVAFMDSVRMGKVIYPISYAHKSETGKIGNYWLRLKLAWFFVETSRNIAIHNSGLVKKYEIFNAVRSKVRTALVWGEDSGKRRIIVRNHILGFGLPYISGRREFEGGTEEMRDYLKGLLEEPWLSVSLISDSNFHKRTIEETLHLQETAEELEETRKRILDELTDKLRMEKEIESFFNEGSTKDHINEAISDLGIPRDVFFDLLTDWRDYVKFFQEVPSYYVMVKLYYGHCKNINRVTEANDIYDVDFLSVAIPYFNGIGMETYWGTIAKQAGLDKKYDTKIITKIDEFPDMLKELRVL